MKERSESGSISAAHGKMTGNPGGLQRELHVRLEPKGSCLETQDWVIGWAMSEALTKALKREEISSGSRRP
jgi:hypothetical protein